MGSLATSINGRRHHGGWFRNVCAVAVRRGRRKLNAVRSFGRDHLLDVVRRAIHRTSGHGGIGRARTAGLRAVKG